MIRNPELDPILSSTVEEAQPSRPLIPSCLTTNRIQTHRTAPRFLTETRAMRAPCMKLWFRCLQTFPKYPQNVCLNEADKPIRILIRSAP